MITVRQPTRITKCTIERMWHLAGDIVNDIARCLFRYAYFRSQIPRNPLSGKVIENLLSLRYFLT